MEAFWKFGTTQPIQRVGLIILCIGIISFFSWCSKVEIVFYADPYYGWSAYYFPDSYDNWFYRLHVMLLPVGLTLTWGYFILFKIKSWIMKNK